MNPDKHELRVYLFFEAATAMIRLFPICFVLIFNLLFPTGAHSRDQIVSETDLPLVANDARLVVVATDGLQMFRFNEVGDGIYWNEPYEGESAPAFDSRMRQEFDQQMRQASISAWFHPYTVNSGDLADINYTENTKALSRLLLGNNITLPKSLKIPDNISGRLKIQGRIVGDERIVQLFSAVLFIHPQKKHEKANIVVMYPTFTYQAYSSIFEVSLYQQPRKPDHQTSVGLDRPFLMGQDTHSPMNDGLIDFLQEEDIAFDVIDDRYLHENPDVLNSYKLVILFGHDEYWTHEMRQAIKRHIDSGKNVLNLSGNVMWFKIVLRDDRIYVNKGSNKKGRDKIETWTGKYLYLDPIESLMGLSYQFAGYPVGRKSETYEDTLALDAHGDRMDQADYDLRKNSIRIFRRDHPVFDGLSPRVDWLSEGEALLKTEVDGAPLVPVEQTWQTRYARIKYSLSRLLRFELGSHQVGRYRVPEKFLEQIDGDLTVLADGWAIYGKNFRHVAFMVELDKNDGGKVLSFGTIGWQEQLANDGNVALITRNAINYLMDQ